MTPEKEAALKALKDAEEALAKAEAVMEADVSTPADGGSAGLAVASDAPETVAPAVSSEAPRGPMIKDGKLSPSVR